MIHLAIKNPNKININPTVHSATIKAVEFDESSFNSSVIALTKAVALFIVNIQL